MVNLDRIIIITSYNIHTQANSQCVSLYIEAIRPQSHNAKCYCNVQCGFNFRKVRNWRSGFDEEETLWKLEWKVDHSKAKFGDTGEDTMKRIRICESLL